MKRPQWLCLIAVALLSACASNSGPNVRVGKDAYTFMPPPADNDSADDYVIGPLDTVDISAYGEVDISSKSVPVDASGYMSLPLIGRVSAAGLTATDLATKLHQLYLRYYVNPQITVLVTSSVSQRVSVQGEVQEPGIYDIRGAVTLLDALSLAKGEAENAALRQVLIIRRVNGQRMIGMFDINRIRRGDDPDPSIVGRDVIVVGHSTSKKIWHDLLRAAPLLNAFTQF